MAPPFPNPPAQACLPAHTQKPRIQALRTFDAPLPLALWHLLSLDAPTVAVVWTLSFACAARVQLPIWVPVLIALAAWSAYVGDRLLDARSGLQTGPRACVSAESRRLRHRHLFHWRHRRVLAPLAVAAVCAAACIVLIFMPPAAVARNTILGAFALAYFSGVHGAPTLRGEPTPSPLESPQTLIRPTPAKRVFARIVSKELLVALIFTATCALPVATRASAPVQIVLPAILFALLAWLNCCAIETWESVASTNRILTAACCLSLAGLLSALLLASRHPRPAALLASGACSALLLAVLDRLRHRLTPLALRASADLVLLAPAVLLLLWPAVLHPA